MFKFATLLCHILIYIYISNGIVSWLTWNCNATVSNILTVLWHEHQSLSATGNILETGRAADPTLMVTGSDVFQLPSETCERFRFAIRSNLPNTAYILLLLLSYRFAYLCLGSRCICHRSLVKRILGCSGSWNKTSKSQ